MRSENQRLAMEIVNKLIEAGSPVWAVGPEHFVVTDTDLPQEVDAHITQVLRSFGDISHLRRDIIQYLSEIGRFVDVEDFDIPESPLPSVH